MDLITDSTSDDVANRDAVGERPSSPPARSLPPNKQRVDQPDRGDTMNEHNDDEPNDEESGDNKPPADKTAILKRHPFIAGAAAVLLLVAIVAGVLYWLDARHYESTDDAFVDARLFSLAPKVSGYVTDVLVTDNQHVAAGDVLAKIDQRDYQIAVEQAQGQVDASTANIDNVQAQISAQQAQIQEAREQVEQAKAQLQFSQQEADRAQELLSKGAGTAQKQQQTNSDLQQQQANVSRATTAVTAAQRQSKALDAQLETARASLAQSKAQLDQARLNMDYTTLIAAQSGRVVRLSGAKGAYVTPGQSISMFVPDEIWVTANYKETQITDMRPGQPVDVRIDAYPERKITGRVASVQPGSGTAFSLLPAENATGNYVKVVQRVPVKIVVDRWPDDVPVGPGMSIVPRAKVR